jgi:hypothetical protein
MAKKIFADVCDDPNCLFCSDDDADSAFWDEFFYSEETREQVRSGKHYTVRLIDEDSGEEEVYEGIKVKQKPKILG